MTVNLKATFKKDQKEFNGLDQDAVRKGLIEEPLARRYVVAMIETSKVVKDIEAGGTLVPTVRVISIEVTEGDDAIVVKEILDKVFKTRTGRHVEPTLFDSDDPQAVADAEHVSAILNGALPSAPSDSDQAPDLKPVECGSPTPHEPHSGDGWTCAGVEPDEPPAGDPPATPSSRGRRK